ncbi:MAG: electron transfer flavoprotein subunit beta/FixA family protein [Methyloceanibacter sp.]
MTGSPLNILVCLKFIPDPNQLQADAEGHPDLARAPFRISTFDENAIEAGLQLAAQNGGRVFGLSVLAGAMPPRDVLLRSLAMGLEALYLVKDENNNAVGPYRLAQALAGAVRAIQAAENISSFDVFITGEASADQFNAQVGPRVAVALDIPAITYATKLAIEQGKLIAHRSTENTSETLEADLPALVTVGNEINQARIPTVLQVMGASKKPVKELPIGELPGFDLEEPKDRPCLRTLDITAPPSSRKRIIVVGDNPEEMAANLLSLLGADGEVKV